MTMNGLWVTPELASAIVNHARVGMPQEICGILAGSADGAVRRIVSVPNVAEQPDVTYYMDEETLVQTMSELQASDLELLGFYHSHPKGRALPSSTDIRSASYPAAAYVIIGMGVQPPEIAAWKIHAGEVERIPLIISINQPQPEEPAQNRPQIAAILSAAVIAVLILIAISLSLLPPAPPVPIP